MLPLKQIKLQWFFVLSEGRMKCGPNLKIILNYASKYQWCKSSAQFPAKRSSLFAQAHAKTSRFISPEKQGANSGGKGKKNVAKSPNRKFCLL